MPRYARPPTAAAPEGEGLVPGSAWTPWPGLARLLAGVALSVLVLLLGLLAKTGQVSSLDQHIAAHDRTSALTMLARAISTIATPETVGAGLMILVPVILVVARRRLDALKVFIPREKPHQFSRPGHRLSSAARRRTISDLMKLCSRQRRARHPSSDSALPVTGRGTIFPQGSKPRRQQCSPAGGYQAPSLPYGGPANTH